MYHSSRKTSSHNEQTTQKVLNYVTHTSYFEYLRNHYLSFRGLGKNELVTLFKSAQLLRISQERSMVISFNQPTVCVVIYGEVTAEGKSYSIGKFFIIGQVKLTLSFKQKSLIVMIHKQCVETEMQKFQDDYFKKKLIEKLLPIELLRLTKKQLKNLMDACDFRSSFADEQIVRRGGNQFGLYLLLDGTFSIVSKEGIKIGEINLEYFGEEILWEEDYQFGLTTQSVECRYIFISKEILMTTFNQNNINNLKTFYYKRLQARKQLQKNMEENINYTKDFMNRMNVKRKAAVINPEYSQPPTALQKKIKKQLRFQNVELSNRLNTSASSFIPSRKITHQSHASTQRMNTLYQDSIISQETNFQIFEPKLYRDQRAKSESIFRRRVKSEVADKSSVSKKQQRNVGDKDVQSLKNLPKTLSVLLKYYESTEKLHPRPKTVKVQFQRGFVPCTKQRRMMTTMKLHKEIFMREYFELKAIEDKAFKTWR